MVFKMTTNEKHQVLLNGVVVHQKHKAKSAETTAKFWTSVLKRIINNELGHELKTLKTNDLIEALARWYDRLGLYSRAAKLRAAIK